jgi:hypothetical protein
MLLTFDRIHISVSVSTKIVLPRLARSLRISSTACDELLERFQIRLSTFEQQDIYFFDSIRFVTLEQDTSTTAGCSSWMFESQLWLAVDNWKEAGQFRERRTSHPAQLAADSISPKIVLARDLLSTAAAETKAEAWKVQRRAYDNFILSN